MDYFIFAGIDVSIYFLFFNELSSMLALCPNKLIFFSLIISGLLPFAEVTLNEPDDFIFSVACC